MLIVIAGFPSAFIGIFFTGALLIEVIFSLDGLGLLGFEAAINRDYPIMFGTLYIYTLIGLLLGLISDLTYALIDPRIDFARREQVSMTLTPLMRRRLHNFRANRRGYWSLWIFLAIFGVTLCAEVIANDKPLLVRYEERFYLPIFRSYPETTFGGVFPTEAVYRDPALIALIEAKGWMVW